jgi:sortase A
VAAGPTPIDGSIPTGLGGLGLGLTEPPPPGNAVAKLVIPRIGVDWVVVQGVDRGALKDGPGHFPESPMPGEFGNVAIAGHRTTHGEPFADLDLIQPGDDIYLTDLLGQQYRYRATDSVIVRPSDYQLLVPAIDPFKATMTLITCNPRFSTSQRLAVRAELVLADSPPPRLPRFYLPADPNAGTGLDTEGTGVSGVSMPPSEVTPSTDAAVNPGSLGTTQPVVAAATSRTVAASQDALSAGWFSDPGAWPHVALWGAALVAWCLACYALARGLRRVWVGLVVGAAPFVVLLYFWFENVNRLLPPNL